jgi:superfamily II DNA or RNA helicase
LAPKFNEVIVGENVQERLEFKEGTPVVLRKSSHLPFFFISGYLKPSVIKALETDLSYEVQGHEYADTYKTGEWDGKELLLYATKRTGQRYFPSGLLDVVKEELEDFGVEYTVDYPEVEDLFHIKLNWKSDIELYPDQQEAVDAALNAGVGTICMPTGTGKTVVAMAIMNELKVKTIIVVHRKELVKQWVDALWETFGYEAGVVGSGKEKWKDITVVMVQSMLRKKVMPRPFDLIIMDENHHTPAKSAYRLAMKCNATYRFGLSATPNRADGADLKMFAATGKIIYKSRPESAILKRRIVRPEFRFVETTHPRSIYQGMPFHEAYTLGITANEDRNYKIVAQAKELLKEGHKVYIHVEEVAHGQWLAGHIEEAEFVCGEDKKAVRDKIIRDFSRGKIKILVSTLLGEGVNIPSITAIIMAGGKKSESGCIQKIGRALRALPGKNKAIVVDFRDKGAYLFDHWQKRYEAYKKFYGKYCPNL